MKKLYFYVFFIAFACISFTNAVQAASVRIDTPKIELELSPGESYSAEISGENVAEEELKTRIYLEDWKYKDSGKGDKDFFPAGSTERSASQWFTFSPSEGVYKPYEKVTVRYTIKVPENASGAYYTVLFFETILGTAKQADGSQVLVTGRIGAIFLIRIKGTVRAEGKLSAIELVPPKGNAPLVVKTTLENTGNVEIIANGKFLAMSESGKIAARGDLGSIYTQPGQSASRESEWVGRLASGKYDAILTYDLGNGDIRTEERAFTVP